MCLQESCNKLESGSPVRLKELEHPSPVSVLEQPASEGENYTIGSCDGVNVDLQGEKLKKREKKKKTCYFHIRNYVSHNSIICVLCCRAPDTASTS